MQWLALLGLAGAASTAFAGLTEINFNSDPSGIVTIQGVPEWRPNGGASGANGDGYLSVTDSLGGQSGNVVFGDTDNGLIVASFKFECDLRIGGGTGQPADGFSINYASESDSIVQSGSGWAGTDNEPAPSGLAEEGTRTGLAIGFDTWQSAQILGVQDVVGLSVRLDEQLLVQFPVPLRPGNSFSPGQPNPGAQGNLYEYNEAPYRNLATTHANYLNSLQTGALSDEDLNFDGVVDGNDAGTPQPPFFEGDTEWPKWIKNLKWERFTAELTADSKVILTWKGVELTPPGGLTVSFTPRKGRIVFGARTGGAWEAHHVDNIKLTTEGASKMILGAATGNPIGFSLSVVDGPTGPTALDPATIGLKLNGTVVTGATVTKNGDTTTITYQDINNPLAPGSTNTVELTAKDVAGDSQTRVSEFVAPAYTVLPATAAVTGVDTSKPGFLFRPYQVDVGTANTISRAERQLRGDLGPNVADTFGTVGGVFEVADVINFDQAAGAQGNYNANNGFPENFIPGLPGSSAIGDFVDNVAAEITTYAHFDKAGVYTLIFNSDDGFRTYLGEGEVVNSLILSQFDGGRGASDTPVTLVVQTPGYYPLKTVWFEGGGGANLEWSAVNADGVAALLNDTASGGVRTYRARSSAKPAQVTFVNPSRNSGNPYLANVPVVIDITDGATAVDQGSIAVTINGTAAANATKSKSGSVTTVTIPAGLLPAGTVTVGIAFNAGAEAYSGSYTFTVQSYANVPPSFAVSNVDTSKPGFVLNMWQTTAGRGNNVDEANLQLLGAWGPNVVDPANLQNGSQYIETGVINYDQGAGNAGNFNGNNGYPEDFIPGIPGTTGSTDNISAEILTVVNFPAAGLYVLGFNSDDGFRTTIGDRNDGMRMFLGEFNGGRGASDTLYSLYINAPGNYPLRTVWFEGGGGANLEWFSVVNGVRHLLNDSADSASLKAYQYANVNVPYVKSLTPWPGSVRHPVNQGFHAVIENGSGIDAASVKLFGNPGSAAASPLVEWPAVVTKSGSQLKVDLDGVALDPSTQYWYRLVIGDRTINGTFTTGTLDKIAFFIEAEDFNYGGGQSDPAASDMSTYRGLAYAGRSATAGVDYNRTDDGSSPIYRIGESPNQPMDRTGDRSRGVQFLSTNFKLGWIGADMWFNYTRNFPEGEYNVYAGLSHGDGPTTATVMAASLQKVTAGATTATQTLEELGSFSAPGSGGWGNNSLVPLKNGDGSLATVALGGSQTLRMSTANGDYDFLLFVPAGGGTGGGAIAVAVNGDGTITLTYEGVLTSAATLGGSYAPVDGASSPYTFTPSGAAAFFKTQ